MHLDTADSDDPRLDPRPAHGWKTNAGSLCDLADTAGGQTPFPSDLTAGQAALQVRDDDRVTGAELFQSVGELVWHQGDACSDEPPE